MLEGCKSVRDLAVQEDLLVSLCIEGLISEVLHICHHCLIIFALISLVIIVHSD